MPICGFRKLSEAQAGLIQATGDFIMPQMSKDQNDLRSGKREEADYPERNDKLVACFPKPQGMPEKTME